METPPTFKESNLFYDIVDRILTSERLGRVADRVSELIFQTPVSSDPNAPHVPGPENPTDLSFTPRATKHQQKV